MKTDYKNNEDNLDDFIDHLLDIQFSLHRIIGVPKWMIKETLKNAKKNEKKENN